MIFPFTILKCGMLIDGRLDEPLENVILVIYKDRIHAIGCEGEVDVPEGSTFMDYSGRTVMPGLIDSHVHLIGTRSMIPLDWIVDPPEHRAMRIVADAAQLLRNGYTCVRCCGSPLSLHLKEVIREGTVLGPRILGCGSIISQTGGHGDFLHSVPLHWATPPRGIGRIADGADECRKAVREQLRCGADFIKICTTGGVTSERDLPDSTQYTTEEINAIVEEAHSAGVRVTSHAQGTKGIKNALTAGVDNIEHGYFLDDEAIEMMIKQGVYLTPTLSIAEITLRYGAEESVPSYILEKGRAVQHNQIASLRKASKAGVNICCGSDFIGARRCAFGDNALELELQVNAGRSPMSVIHSATRVNAEALGLEEEVGVLEPGKQANLMVVDGDPLKDITLLQDTNRIVAVYTEGLERTSNLGRKKPDHERLMASSLR